MDRDFTTIHIETGTSITDVCPLLKDYDAIYLVYDQAYVVVDSENGYFRIAYDTGGKYENGFAYAPQNNFYKE